jgi:Flp pilus assembly protein TadG
MRDLLARLRTRSGPPERGSSVVEVVILAPALGLFLALIIAGGRVALAHQAVESSAAEAARAASIARTQGQAGADATAAAASSLASQNTRCVNTSVSVDTSGFATPVGTPASVGATVTCRVDLAGLLPGLPGSMNITATMRSPLDTYRER